MKRHSDKNLAVIQNFILHLTHVGDEKDFNFKKVMSWTPETLYQVANEYIAEDHVDGLGNPEDIIPKYTAESSFTNEDIDRKFPEHVIIVADYGDEIGTRTVSSFSNIDNLYGANKLINEIETPSYG